MEENLNGILIASNGSTTYIQLNGNYVYLDSNNFGSLDGTEVYRDGLEVQGWLLLAEEALIRWRDE